MMNNKHIYLLGIIIMGIIVITASFIIINTSDNQKISIVGSSTVQPVAQALADAYMVKHPEVKVTVQGGDSSVGVQSVKSGLASIGTVSRNLTENEGEGLTQYQIGKDGIAIIVNPSNPVNSLTTSQLKDIYEGKITNWKQVGGKDAPISVVIREAGSGTRLAFEETLFDSPTIAKNVTIALSTYQVMQDVAVNPNAIGYLSRNSLNPEVKLLKINDFPLTAENIENGRYTLQRPLIFLVKGTPNVTVKDFIDFTLSDEGKSIVNNLEYNNVSSNESSNLGIGVGGGI